MSSATIPVVEEMVSEDLWPYKREKKPSFRERRRNPKTRKTRAKTESRTRAKTKQKPRERNNTQWEKERRNRGKNPKTEQRPKKTQSKTEQKNLHREGNQLCIAFIPVENNQNKISIHRSRHLRSFPSLSQNMLKKKTKADRGHRSKKGKQKERYQAGKSHQQPFQPELRHRLQRL